VTFALECIRLYRCSLCYVQSNLVSVWESTAWSTWAAAISVSCHSTCFNYFMLMFVENSTASFPLWGDGSTSSGSNSAGYGLYTTSKQMDWPALFCPFLLSHHFPTSFMWLHGAGYLKTSNACEALTISEDCCWVISGKEVGSQISPLPPREHSRSHTCTTPMRTQKRRFSEQYAAEKQNYLQWIQRLFLKEKKSVMPYVVVVTN